MPKPSSGRILIKELRLTPVDQQPIVIEETDLKYIDKLVLCEEGTPNGKPALHYHGYIEAKISESTLRKLILKWCHTDIGGNSVYFTRDPHEHTFGYITKQNNFLINRGFDQSTIDDWLIKSDEYRRNKQTQRKRDDRKREMELLEVYTKVKNNLHNMPREYISSRYIVQEILKVCYADKVRFPTRSQMESYVNQLLYPHNVTTVVEYYIKSFSDNLFSK